MQADARPFCLQRLKIFTRSSAKVRSVELSIRGKWREIRVCVFCEWEDEGLGPCVSIGREDIKFPRD